jgi:hypothetical protein
MTTFAEQVDDYLRLRRALGFKLEEHARLLPKSPPTSTRSTPRTSP